MTNNDLTIDMLKESDLEKIIKKVQQLSVAFDLLQSSINKVSKEIKNLNLNNINSQMKKMSNSTADIAKEINTHKSSNLFASLVSLLPSTINSLTQARKEILAFGGEGQNISNSIKNVSNKLLNLGQYINTLKSSGVSGLIQKVSTDISGLGIDLNALIPVLSEIGLASGGIAGLTLSFDGAKNSAYNLKKEIDDTSVESLKMTGSFAAATAAGAALGSLIPVIGPAIGGLTGFIIAGIGAQLGFNEAIRELAKEDLFGNVNLSVSQWKDHLDAASLSISNASEKYGALRTTITSLSETFMSNADSLDLYGIRFGVMSQKITEQDMANIQNAVQNMCSSTSQMIDENTNFSLSLWGNLFSEMNTMTEEQEKNMLESILNNSNGQKEALEEAQNKIIEIYSNAMETRGQLTTDEYVMIQEQMSAIREMTVQEMTTSEAQVELMKAEFSDKKLAMDEESYNNYKSALTQFESEKRKIAEDGYAAAVIDAKKRYDQGIIDEETYIAAKKTAYDKYQSDVAEINQYIVDSNEEVHSQLLDAWNSITGDTSSEANEQRRIIKEMYSNLGLDTSELINSVSIAAEDVGSEFSDTVSDNLKMDPCGIYRGYNNILSNLEQSIMKLSGTTIGVQLFGNAADILRQAKINYYAHGGFVPNVGQLFVANEPGNPELIGNIGGSTAVVNNQMILDGIHSAMRSAIIEGMQLVYRQNTQGDTYVDIYVDGVFTERKLIKENEKYMLKTGKSVFSKG